VQILAHFGTCISKNDECGAASCWLGIILAILFCNHDNGLSDLSGLRKNCCMMYTLLALAFIFQDAVNATSVQILFLIHPTVNGKDTSGVTEHHFKYGVLPHLGGYVHRLVLHDMCLNLSNWKGLCMLQVMKCDTSSQQQTLKELDDGDLHPKLHQAQDPIPDHDFPFCRNTCLCSSAL